MRNSQLHEDEEHKKKKAKGSGRLNTDGMPKLFTGPEFITAAKKHYNEKDAREKEKEQRAEEGTKFTTELAAWKTEEAACVDRNNLKRADHKTVVAAWKTELERAKREKRHLGWLKPKLDELEKGLPRPKKSVAVPSLSTLHTSHPDEGGDDNNNMMDVEEDDEHELDSDGPEDE